MGYSYTQFGMIYHVSWDWTSKKEIFILDFTIKHWDFMEFYNFEVNLQNLKKIWKFPEIGVPPNQPF